MNSEDEERMEESINVFKHYTLNHGRFWRLLTGGAEKNHSSYDPFPPPSHTPIFSHGHFFTVIDLQSELF